MDQPEDRQLHQVGARYGVRGLTRDLERCFTENREEYNRLHKEWQRELRSLQKAKTGNEAINACIQDFISSDTGRSAMIDKRVHTEGKGSRRTDTIVMHMLQPATRFRDSTCETYADDRTTIPERLKEQVFQHMLHKWKVSRKKVDEHLSYTNLVFHRHALERFYEREGVETGELRHTIGTWIDDYMKACAFMIAAEITRGPMTYASEISYIDEDLTRPATVIPCGNGLMLCEVTPTQLNNVNVNAVYSLQKVVSKEIVRNPFMGSLDSMSEKGTTFYDANVILANTYISADMMRPEQAEWRKRFLETAAKCDLEELCEEVFSMREPHIRNMMHGPIEDETIDGLRADLASITSHARTGETGLDVIIRGG